MIDFIGTLMAYADLDHAIVITTKPRFVVKRTCNTEARLGGDKNKRDVNLHKPYYIMEIRYVVLQLYLSLFHSSVSIT